jgi:hypothetical protein
VAVVVMGLADESEPDDGDAGDCGDAGECAASVCDLEEEDDDPDDDDEEEEEEEEDEEPARRPADLAVRSGDANAADADADADEAERSKFALNAADEDGGDKMTACATSIAICPFGVHFFCAEFEWWDLAAATLVVDAAAEECGGGVNIPPDCDEADADRSRAVDGGIFSALACGPRAALLCAIDAGLTTCACVGWRLDGTDGSGANLACACLTLGQLQRRRTIKISE